MCELSFSRTEFTVHWGFRSKAPHRLKLWVEHHLLRLIATWCRLVPSQKDPSRGEWSIFTTKDGVDGFASGTDRENTSTFRLYLYTSRKRRPLQIIKYQLHNDNSGMCVDTYCYLQRSFLNVNEKSVRQVIFAVVCTKYTLIFSTFASDMPWNESTQLQCKRDRVDGKPWSLAFDDEWSWWHQWRCW